MKKTKFLSMFMAFSFILLAEPLQLPFERISVQAAEAQPEDYTTNNKTVNISTSIVNTYKDYAVLFNSDALTLVNDKGQNAIANTDGMALLNVYGNTAYILGYDESLKTVNLDTSSVSSSTLPDYGVGTYFVAGQGVDSKGILWQMIDVGSGSSEAYYIIRLDINTMKYIKYKIDTSKFGQSPENVRFCKDGHIWFQTGDRAINNVTFDGSNIKLNSYTTDIDLSSYAAYDIDSKGNLWFEDASKDLSSGITEFSLSGNAFTMTNMYDTYNENYSYDFDVLKIDDNDNVWCVALPTGSNYSYSYLSEIQNGTIIPRYKFKNNSDVTNYVQVQNENRIAVAGTYITQTSSGDYNDYTIVTNINKATTPQINYDLNGDGTVDSKDLALLSKSYNAKTGASNYSASYDFNSDGIIDIYDITLLSKQMK
ncbi:hypothetical protein IAI10_05680 [Clostridium sp. 19966]|uniref:dockerin type I domain-containing protein n=1 Tax=Clostridium sp. 19966 TaxID=2768166 RepID=UPI0028DE237F|nr:dockerin type I domain-containing protein [Clostridium sp. 19966]MDT8716138.1 hypothetical protein [Clostridium sp. 19966]